MPNETNELAKSKEMITFYRTLAAVQTNAIFHIMSGNDTTEMKQRAKEETELLQGLMISKGGKCPDGQVWNASTGQCE